MRPSSTPRSRSYDLFVPGLAHLLPMTKRGLSYASSNLFQTRGSFSFGNDVLLCNVANFRVGHRQRDAGLEPEHFHECCWL